MLSKIQSLGCRGVSGYAVSVECHVSNGLPGFDIVGLPDAAVKEARERVRSAIKTNGMKFPVSRLTGGHDAFGAEAEDEALLLAVNRAAHTVRCHVELTCPGAGLNEETRLSFVRSSYDRALECVTGARAAIHDGVAAFDLPPRSAQIYRLENRHGTETGS